jgi:hypothetical protein
MMGIPKFIYWSCGSLVCFFLGFCSQESGTNAVREMRQMERVPDVSANHVISGEVSIEGNAKNAGKFVLSRYSRTRCLYYAYLKEREETDSEGDTKWVKVDQGHEFTDFFISDETGKVLVQLKYGGVKPDLSMDYREKKGRYRYTEWRIEDGEAIYAFAMGESMEGLNSLRFDLPGSFTPILSNQGALENRGGLGTSGVMYNAIGVSFFCFGCLFICFLLRVHRVLAFLSMVSVLVTVVLIWAYLSMMEADLKDGHERLLRLEKSASEAISQSFGELVGWDSIPSKSKDINDPLARDRVMGIREDYLASIFRTNEILARFPENILSTFWGIKSWEMPDVTNLDLSQQIKKTPIKEWVVLLSMFVSFILVVLGAYFGFRRIKIKRYIENIPTSLSSGLAFGPCEIKGTVEFGQNKRLKGPETGQECVYYRYKVTETRGSGKNRKTVVIKDEVKMRQFFCLDSEGKAQVSPEGAEITTELKYRKRRGRRTYYEWHLAEKTQIYILGSAVVDDFTGDQLIIADAGDEFPFIVSDESETEIMLKQGREGLFGIGLAQNAMVFLGLVVFGALGSFAATDFLLSAMIAPIFLAISMIVLMFNDLVFLRNRVKRAWANIEVSLKKRADLIPNLENVVKTYLAHENELMQSIADLRKAVTGKKGFTPTQADYARKQETVISDRLFALNEEYPNLMGEKMMGDFMNRITRMENEVSMMRAGYNDGVERYCTVKQRFPEVLLAKAFKFEDKKPMMFSSEIRMIPKIDFETNQKDVTLPGQSIQENGELDASFAESQIPKTGKGQADVDSKEISSIYIHKGGNQFGPYSLSQIEEYTRAGNFTQDDLACWDNQNWEKISEIPGFKSDSN